MENVCVKLEWYLYLSQEKGMSCQEYNGERNNQAQEMLTKIQATDLLFW